MAVAFDPFVIAADLAQCVEQALKDEDRGEDVWEGTCCVRPGAQVAWDSCCEGNGQAWVVMTMGFPTTNFPLQEHRLAETNCLDGVVSLALNFEIGVLRCATETDCDAMEAKAALLMGDLKALMTAANCCFSADQDDTGDQGWRLITLEMLGPEGGCAGAKITISVHSEYPCCPLPTP